MKASSRRSVIRSVERGFSLIEVLVSFVLLSMSLAVILQIFSTNLRAVDAVRKQTHALILAESKLAGLGNGIPLTPGELAGESGAFNWQLTVSPHVEDADRDDGANHELYDVAMTVNWERGAGKSEIRLKTLRVGAAQ
jgi:general secretion pathway protein I